MLHKYRTAMVGCQLILGLLLSGAANVHAQNATVEDSVFDAQSGQPCPGMRQRCL